MPCGNSIRQLPALIRSNTVESSHNTYHNSVDLMLATAYLGVCKIFAEKGSVNI